MKYYPKFLIAILFVVAACSQQEKTTETKYPATKTIDHTDTYFGVDVADPYRWLEDDRSEETADWVKRENEVTHAYLDNIPFIRKMLLIFLYRYNHL